MGTSAGPVCLLPTYVEPNRYPDSPRVLRVTVWLTWKWLLRPLLTTNRTPSICKGNTSGRETTGGLMPVPEREGAANTVSQYPETNLYTCGGTLHMNQDLGEKNLDLKFQNWMPEGRKTRGAQ